MIRGGGYFFWAAEVQTFHILFFLASMYDFKGQGTKNIPNVFTNTKASKIPGMLTCSNSFNCHVVYHVFSNQESAQKPAWKPYMNTRKIGFVVCTSLTDFEGFRNMVKANINPDWDCSRDLVCKDLERDSCQLIFLWVFSVALMIHYLKGRNSFLKNYKDCEYWRENSLNNPDRKLVLVLQMEKPISDASNCQPVIFFHEWSLLMVTDDTRILD